MNEINGFKPALLPLIAAGTIVLFVVTDLGGVGLGGGFGVQALVWLVAAGAIAFGGITMQAHPARAGLITGAGAMGAAAMLSRLTAIMEYDFFGAFGTADSYSCLLLAGLCGAAAFVGAMNRWAVSPLHDANVAVAGKAAGAVVVVGSMVPSDGLDFAQWNLLSDVGLPSLLWFVRLGLLAATMFIGVGSRGRWGRWLAVGALAPTIVNLFANKMAEYPATAFFSMYTEPSIVGLLVVLGAAGVTGWSFSVANEHVAETQPVRSSAANFAPVWSGGGGLTSTNASAEPWTAGSVSPAPPAGSLVYGTFGARFFGVIVDGLIGAVFQVVIVVVLYGSVLSNQPALADVGLAVVIAGPLTYAVVLCRRIGSRGQSWGHQVAGVVVVDAVTAMPIGAGRAFWRLVVRGLAALPCYLGLLTSLWDPKKQGWHDKAMNTIVVTAASRGPLTAGPSKQGIGPGVRFDDAPPPMAPPPPPFRSAPLADPASLGGRSAIPDLSGQTVPRTARMQSAMLVLDAATSIPLTTTVVVGRMPATDGFPAATAQPVHDSTMTVSKTHAAVGVDSGGVWLQDLHSSNGTEVAEGLGAFRRLIPGERTHVSLPASIRLGDHELSVKGGGLP